MLIKNNEKVVQLTRNLEKRDGGTSDWRRGMASLWTQLLLNVHKRGVGNVTRTCFARIDKLPEGGQGT